MRKNRNITGSLIVLSICVSLSCFGQTKIPAEKEAEIRRTLQLTGVQQTMEQLKTQMISAMRAQMKDVPSEFWTRLETKMDTSELLEKLLPLYDKYYTIEDLRAVNAFYASPVGRRLVATVPKITKESMAIGMEWGKRVGAQIAREAEMEMKKKRDVEKQG